MVRIGGIDVFVADFHYVQDDRMLGTPLLIVEEDYENYENPVA